MAKEKKQKVAKKIGRPTTYTPELAAKICEELALGRSLRKVCEDDGMPAMSSVFLWLRAHKEFSEQYAKAKEESADALFEETIDIADETLDIIKSGAEKKSNAYANAQRLRVDTRKWYMSKMKPKKYGDKLDLTTKGDKLPTPIYGGLSRHNSDTENIQTEETD